MKIAVLGAGAIGIYYGVRLALAGNDVRFLLRADLPAVQARGTLIVHLTGKTVEIEVHRTSTPAVPESNPPAAARGSGVPAAYLPAADAQHPLHPTRPPDSAAAPIPSALIAATTEEIGPVDLVLVTAKVMANPTLSSVFPPHLGPHTPNLTLQNGLGADEYLADRFGAHRVYGALAYIANNRIGPGEVACHHPGSLTLGSFLERGRDAPVASSLAAKRLSEFVAAFKAAGVRATAVDSLASARWHKLVWNIPFNGLAIAAGNISTDRICGNPALAAEVHALMREVQAAAAALGHPISDAFLQQQYDLTPGLGAYQPSTLVDVLAGREIEVEPIWGEPLRRAREAGIPCPRLQLLYALLKRP